MKNSHANKSTSHCPCWQLSEHSKLNKVLKLVFWQYKGMYELVIIRELSKIGKGNTSSDP